MPAAPLPPAPDKESILVLYYRIEAIGLYSMFWPRLPDLKSSFDVHSLPTSCGSPFKVHVYNTDEEGLFEAEWASKKIEVTMVMCE